MGRLPAIVQLTPVNTAAALLLLLTLTACGSSGGGNNSPTAPPVDNSTNFADVILQNGLIYTVDSAKSRAEAVAVKDGNIVYVGNDAGVASYQGANTRIIDLKGKLVLPGIHDGHLHPLEAGSTVAGTCMVSNTADITSTKFQTLLQNCAPQQQGDIDWVVGFGHSIAQLLDLPPEITPASILDTAIPSRPVVIMEETSHSMWVNSRALEVAGIDRSTPDPQGGLIVKDGNGDPTGLLLDNAGDNVFELAFLPPTDILLDLHYEGLLFALQRIRRNGITSIANARVYTRRGYLDVWKRAEREGRLTARTVLALWAYPTLLPGQSDEGQIQALAELYQNDPDQLLRVSQVKFYSDGLLENETAATLDPYPEEDQLPFFISADHRGLNYFTQERLTQYIAALEQLGFDMHIHTIGDRGVREALNAIEAAMAANGPGIERRHRLTHLESVDPLDYGRFVALDVIADFQVAGDFTLPLPGQSADGYIPVRSIYDTGARYTLSSDWDVSDLSPFVGMQNALSRAEQSLPDLDAAIRGYTINAAYLMRSEDRTGSIEVGKLADMIVIDQNIFAIPVDQIGQTRVLLTMLGGEEIYRQSGFTD